MSADHDDAGPPQAEPVDLPPDTGPEALASTRQTVAMLRDWVERDPARREMLVGALAWLGWLALQNDDLFTAADALAEGAGHYGRRIGPPRDPADEAPGGPPLPALPVDENALRIAESLLELADALALPAGLHDDERAQPALDPEALYRHALALMRPDADADDGARGNYALAAWRLADLVEEREGAHAALDDTRRAVAAWRTVTHDFTRGDPLAEALLDLAVRAEQAPAEAAAAADEAVERLRVRFATDPEGCRLELARGLFVASVYHGALGRRPVALETIEDAVAVLRAADEDDRAAARPLLAHCLHNLGLWTQPIRPRAAEPALREAVRIYRALDAEDPGLYADDIATSLASLASLLAVHRHVDEAERLNDEAVERLRALAEAGVEHMDGALADALIISGSLAEARGDRAEAARLWDEGIERLWPAYEAAPDDKGYTTALLLACRLRLADREPTLKRDLRPLVEAFNRLQWPDGPGLIHEGRWTLDGRRPAP